MIELGLNAKEQRVDALTVRCVDLTVINARRFVEACSVRENEGVIVLRIDLRDWKAFWGMKHTSLVIVNNETKSETTLALDIRSPFEVKTRLLPSIEASSDEELSTVFGQIGFCVEVCLDHVLESYQNSHVSLKGYEDIATCELKKHEGLKWRFEVCVQQEQKQIDSLVVAVDTTLNDGTSLSFTQSVPCFELKPIPIIIQVIPSEEFEKGTPTTVRVRIQNRSEISQNITVKLLKNPKRWILAGVMNKHRIVI